MSKSGSMAALSAALFLAATPVLAQRAGEQPRQPESVQQRPQQQPRDAGKSTPPIAAQQRSVPADFTEIVSRLSPSVVAVTTRAAAEDIEQSGSLADTPMRDFLRRFFDEPGRQRGPGRQFRQRQRPSAALGSGFVIDEQGHIVTNNHVVDNAGEIRVVFPDRTNHVAKLVGRDAATDIAVLKIDNPPKNLQPLTWGNSDKMQPGAWTIAIGSPFGLGGTVTVGVLSARSRDIHSGPYDDFLQTDASINTGNSGGPLFNQSGQVIGVNTAIYSPSGGNVGIGFAVSSNVARDVVSSIIDKGYVERGFIGATLQPVTPEIASSLGLPAAQGALVADVTRQGPADLAGLQPGDVLVSYNGKTIENVRELTRAVAATDIGQNVPASVMRNGKSVSLTLSIARRPDSDMASNRRPGARNENAGASRLGVLLAPLGPQAAGQAGLPQGQTGVVVQNVEPGSVADESGLRAGDIIVQVGSQPVNTPTDVSAAWSQAQSDNSDKPLLLRVRRGEGYLFIPVKPA